jgi:hypothetical protein
VLELSNELFTLLALVVSIVMVVVLRMFLESIKRVLGKSLS